MDVILIFLCACFAVANAVETLYMVDCTYKIHEKAQATSPTVQGFTRQVLAKGKDKTGEWFFTENFCTGSHAGTHMDAPAQFCEHGLTVDQIPLTDLFCPLALINVCKQAERDPCYEVQVSDLKKWERDTGCSLNRHIVMFNSCWGAKSGNQQEYLGTSPEDPQFHFPGISEKAATWLVQNRKICGIGIDTIAVDSGCSGSKNNYPVHRILLCADIYLLENVANLHMLPTCGADLIVLPMKICGASGAPTRIVAEFTKKNKGKCHSRRTRKVSAL